MKIELPFKVKKPILALGSHTKNTVAFCNDRTVCLSPELRDLDDPQDFEAFAKTTRRFFRKSPVIIAYDPHPQYRSSKYALEHATKRDFLLTVQHHHAHIASCMAENGLANQRVIGVAFDGTGLGVDNALWGAEFLICDYRRFRRIGHLRPIPLLGAEQAIRQPWRLALMWLFLAYGERMWDLDSTFVKKADRRKWRVLKRMYLAGFNSPFSSSMGRLFDAVAVLVLNRHEVHFEGELAMQLEKLARRSKGKAKAYPFGIIIGREEYILDPLPMFKAIILDLKRRQPPEDVAYSFHLTVAEMIKRMLLKIRGQTRLNKAVFSGGVFQNHLLCLLSSGLLTAQGFDVLLHRNLSCSDSSLSLGQIAVASHRH